MRIWIDADACPRAVKEMVYRASKRLGLDVTLVANRPLATPPSERIRSVVVPQGFDVADEQIIAWVAAGDLVVTEDVPLADAVVSKGAMVLTPHGRLLDAANIGEALSMRNFLDGIRSAGVETGGPAPFGTKDKERFAQALDRLLSRPV